MHAEFLLIVRGRIRTVHGKNHPILMEGTGRDHHPCPCDVFFMLKQMKFNITKPRNYVEYKRTEKKFKKPLPHH